MLEPHPPDTWRDFFIHIATMVVGLLIAAGLEQKSLVPYRQCSSGQSSADSELLVWSSVDTAIWTKPLRDLAGQLL